MSNWKAISRIEWETSDQQDHIDARGKTQLGCLQRIADATELMARDHAALIEERDRYKRWYEEQRAGNEWRNRSMASLRGHITRLRKKIEAA